MIGEASSIIIGADHAGFALKERLKTFLNGRGIAIEDVGTDSESSVDYPDYGVRVGKAVSRGDFSRGILLCGSGVGMSIVANRFPRVRAALCRDVSTARLSRQHNDANVLVLAARMTDPETAEAITAAWLDTPFEGGRHQRRLDKIRGAEAKLDEYKENRFGRGRDRQRDGAAGQREADSACLG